MTDSSILERRAIADQPITNLPATRVPETLSPSQSAISWAAVFAGAAGAAALSLILLILGTGLGLSSVSPFTGQGASATTFGASTIAWLTFTQLAASGLGGYLAGRLRTRWVSTHPDEVYFRDTAHGFLAWAVATLVTAAMLSSVIGSIVGTGAGAAGSLAGSAGVTAAAATASVTDGSAKRATSDGGNGYFVDKLFRSSASVPGAAASSGGSEATSTGGSPSTGGSLSQEADRIFASALQGETLPQDDRQYLGQLVSQRTGLSQADAEKRVNDDFANMKAKADQAKAQAQESADKARKAAAYASMWLFVALLVGAFLASLAGTFGGRRRDLV